MELDNRRLSVLNMLPLEVFPRLKATSVAAAAASLPKMRMRGLSFPALAALATIIRVHRDLKPSETG